LPLSWSSSQPRSRRIFRRRTPIDVQKWTVDFLDVDTAILHNLEGVGVLHQTARGLLRVRKWTVLS